MILTEEQKKRLTEFIGEKYVEDEGQYYTGLYTNGGLIPMRIFDTWPDLGACMQALVREGLWKEFYYYYWKCGVEVEYSAWLFRPVNEAGEAHFCALVAEFLERKDE